MSLPRLAWECVVEGAADPGQAMARQPMVRQWAVRQSMVRQTMVRQSLVPPALVTFSLLFVSSNELLSHSQPWHRVPWRRPGQCPGSIGNFESQAPSCVASAICLRRGRRQVKALGLPPQATRGTRVTQDPPFQQAQSRLKSLMLWWEARRLA